MATRGDPRIVTSSSGDPSDDPNPQAPGTWGAPSLLARDPGGEAVFYQGLFGFAAEGTPTDNGFERIRLSAGTHERANVRRLPAGAAVLNRNGSASCVFSAPLILSGRL